MHKTHLEFMDWASRYDTGGPEMRSLAMHEAWLLSLPCPVIRIEGELSQDEVLGQVTDWVRANKTKAV